MPHLHHAASATPSDTASPAHYRAPAALRPGDTVAVVAPAGPFDRATFEAGLEPIAARYDVRLAPGIHAADRYLAGSDACRLEDLQWALGDPAIKAVFCARGGYGTMRLLKRLAPPAPKPLIGFSDITALHLWLQRFGVRSIHGPVVTQLATQPQDVRQRLFGLLESPHVPEPLRGTECFVGGCVEGPLIGGNLSVLTRLIGTPFMPPLESAILLLEDLGERPYRLDRMWTHLELAGLLDRVRGIALGDFSACEERDAAYTSRDVLRDLAAAAGLPCVAGLPIGHGCINQPVPLGARVRLDADACTLTFLEGAVEAQ